MSEHYVLSQKESEAIIRLDGSARYSHTIKRIADWETVWALGDVNGLAVAGDNDGNSGIAIWPHPNYASACAIGDWSTFTPTAIALDEFMEDWIPSLTNTDSYIAVFLTPQSQGVFVPASQFGSDLQKELEQYD